MKLVFDRKFYNNPRFWIFFIIIFNCVYKGIINYLKISDAINYLNDFACIILFIFILQKQKNNRLLGNFISDF